LSILQAFLSRLNPVKMKPATEIVLPGLPNGVTARVLAEPGRVYAVYLKGQPDRSIALELPAGAYKIDWLHPRSGDREPPQSVRHAGGRMEIALPPYEEDLALLLTRR
jgi:hypothetical protein